MAFNFGGLGNYMGMMTQFKAKFAKQEDGVKNDIAVCISNYAQQFRDQVEDSDKTAEVFESAQRLLAKCVADELEADMKNNGTSKELAALNIIHTYSMLQGQQEGEDGAGTKVFHFINDQKLADGYIDEAQFERNAQLLTEKKEQYQKEYQEYLEKKKRR